MVTLRCHRLATAEVEEQDVVPVRCYCVVIVEVVVGGVVLVLADVVIVAVAAVVLVHFAPMPPRASRSCSHVKRFALLLSTPCPS